MFWVFWNPQDEQFPKTVPGFEFRATFEGDIEGFILVQVLVATTVFSNVLCYYVQMYKTKEEFFLVVLYFIK